MLNGKHGSHIFPRTISGHEYNTLIQDSLQVVGLQSVDEQVTFLNLHVRVGKLERIV